MKITPLSKNQIAKVVKTIGYVAVSSAISAVIALLAQQPDLVGPLTPLVNVALVLLKQALTDDSVEGQE